MKSKTKRAERAKLVADARALIDAVPDGQEMPAETTAKFDEMMAAADKLKEEIDRIERLEGIEAGLSERMERRAGREGISTDEAAARAALETEAFNSYMRNGMGGLSEEHRAIALPRFQAAQGTGSGSAGGYTAPEGFYGQIISAELAFGGMMEVAYVFDTTSGNPLPIPTDNDTSNEGAILGENTQVSTQDVTFGAITLNAHTYSSKLVLVANQLLQDSAFNLEAFLAQKLGTRLARIGNRHFTVGTGASQPTGIVTASTLGVTAASATAITADELINLEHSVDPAYRLNACWCFADSTLKTLKQLKDGNGRYLWNSGLVVKEPDTILGYSYSVNQHMAAIATGNKSVVFGDCKKYFIRRVAGVQVLRLTERYADYNQTGFLAFQRLDGQLVDAGTHPVKHLIQA